MIIGVDPHKSPHTATAVDAATNTADRRPRLSSLCDSLCYGPMSVTWK